MSPAIARPLLHTAHLAVFILLLGTGLLLFVPGLRALVTGGYSQLIRELHRWGGVAFVALPVAILWPSGVRRTLAPPADRTRRLLWQRTHLAVTVVFGALFALTGFIVWGKRTFSEALRDGSLALHDWLTYAAVVLLAVHLLDVGAAALLARLHAAREATAQATKT